VSKTGKPAKPATGAAVASGPSPEQAALAAAAATFERGDYVAARAQLAGLADAPGLAEGERAEARGLLSATRIDGITWQIVLAGAALLGLVLAFTESIQPHS
jgi:hypothetical protein